MGYQMDSTCNGESWDGNAYSFTVIGNSKVSEGDSLCASVFCFVSKEFNGTWVILLSEGATIGNTKFEYDLKKKDSWQKLSVKVVCNAGDAPVYLYFSKYGSADFSSLKGHVIFAYPQVEIIRKSGEIIENSEHSYLYDGIGKFKIFGFEHRSLLSFEGSDAGLNPTILKDGSEVVANLDDQVKLLREKNIVNISNYVKNSHLITQLKLLSFSIPSQRIQYDQDLIRNWIARIISEDTAYYGYKSDIKTNKISSVFFNDRLVRWQFAWQVFVKEYSLKEKIFGGGFDFLNWYGYYFLKHKTMSDYPHNPFLSILLYSGIVGLSFYILLLFMAVKYYLKYLKKFYLLFIFFIIIFFFSFFSGGSPFDPPIMGFFTLLPFYIHSIYKNDNQKINDTIINHEDSDHRD
jgi:hypothetical protein